MSPVTRPLVEFVDPPDVATRPLRVSLSSDAIPGKPLAGDPEAGDGACLLELPAGWRGGGGSARHPFELIVLEGSLAVDGSALEPYGYLAVPAGGACPALAVSQPALVWVDFIADVVEHALVPWDAEGFTERPRVGAVPPPGLTRKIVRGSAEGSRGFFLRVPAGWHEDRGEWHDVAEACIVLEGDLWHVRANGGAGGTMIRHSYFWRPAHVLHSPMGSTGGALMFVYVDGELINHYPEDEGGLPTDVHVPGSG